jgi:hypothetical protein
MRADAPNTVVDEVMLVREAKRYLADYLAADLADEAEWQLGLRQMYRARHIISLMLDGEWPGLN